MLEILLLLALLQPIIAEDHQARLAAPSAARHLPSLAAHEWQRYRAQLCGIQVRPTLASPLNTLPLCEAHGLTAKHSAFALTDTHMQGLCLNLAHVD